VKLLPPTTEGHKAYSIDDSPQTPNVALDFLDDEEIGAWIWKSSRMGKMTMMNDLEEAGSPK
jgi:hypothetical protein